MLVHHISTDLYRVSSRISAAVTCGLVAVCTLARLVTQFNVRKSVALDALLHFNPLCSSGRCLDRCLQLPCVSIEKLQNCHRMVAVYLCVCFHSKKQMSDRSEEYLLILADM